LSEVRLIWSDVRSDGTPGREKSKIFRYNEAFQAQRRYCTLMFYELTLSERLLEKDQKN